MTKDCALQAFGDVGYAARIDHCATLAKHFEESIQSSGGIFVLSHPRSFVNVCFWWIPPALRPFQAATASREDLTTLGKVSWFGLPVVFVCQPLYTELPLLIGQWGGCSATCLFDLWRSLLLLICCAMLSTILLSVKRKLSVW